MSNLLVIGNRLRAGGKVYTCAIGSGGFSNDKREGDGCTPLGAFYLRECWYRADRISAPDTGLPLCAIQKSDGWCDDPKSPDYNKLITLPSRYSHEQLWRDDPLYDLVIPLGYNDGPIRPGRGSAIFMHIAKPGYEATEGCVALALQDLLAILPKLTLQSQIEIRAK